MQRRLWLIIIPPLIVLGLGAWFFSARHGSKEAGAYTPVVVTRGNLRVSIDATGTIVPAATIDLAPAAAGRIHVLMVEPGDRVRAGQVLARLDETEAQARLRSARDALAVAEKKLVAAKESALINSVQAVLQLKRAKDILSSSGAAPVQSDSAPSGEAAEAPMDGATLATDLAGAVSDTADIIIGDQIAEARAAVEDARDNLAAAEREAAGTVVTAPCDGVVTAVNGRVGAIASGDSPLFTMADTGQLYLQAEVDENDIIQVKPGQPATITLNALADREFQGKVVDVGEIGSAQDGVATFPVKIVLEDPGHLVKAGMTADAEIIIAERDDVLLVPNGALEDRMGRRVVRVHLPDGRVVYRRVTTGLRTETATEILSGLKAGERVAIPSPRNASASPAGGKAPSQGQPWVESSGREEWGNGGNVAGSGDRNRT